MMAADWKGLPSDLLKLVLQKLINPPVDHVRMGAVCSAWRSAALEEEEEGLIPPISKHPWLLHPTDDEEGKGTTIFTFYSLCDKEYNSVYKTWVPNQLREKRYIGSSKGWLVVSDISFEIYMIHPLLGSVIPLPSPATLPEFEPQYDPEGRIAFYVWLNVPHPPENIYHYYLSKVIFTCPINSENCTVLAMKHGGFPVAYASVGDSKWTPLEGVSCIKDMVRYKGQFYAVRGPGQSKDLAVLAVDFTGPSPEMRQVALFNKYHTENTYLVESSEHLLLVLRYVSSSMLPSGFLKYRTRAFEVYQLDEMGGQFVEVKNIGDQALFLGDNYSLSLSSLEFPELQGNCIYFTDDMIESCLGRGGLDMGVFHLQDGSIEPIHGCPSELKGTPPIWFLPDLR